MLFPPSLFIRTAALPDADTLSLLGRNTFSETFAAQNTKEDMRRYLDTQFAPAQLEKELNETRTVFFLAFLNGNVVGYAKLHANIPESNPIKTPAMELSRLYVQKAQQGQKIGAALLQHCVNFSKNAHYNTLWLGVWEHNLKAIRFYRDWGFKPFGSHLFMLGNDAQTDILMQKSLE